MNIQTSIVNVIRPMKDRPKGLGMFLKETFNIPRGRATQEAIFKINKN